MPTQHDIRQQITRKIVDALKAGGIPPWRRGWTVGGGMPRNIVSGKRYSGINPLLLQMAADRHGFGSKHWGTFNQWKALRGSVRRRPSHVPAGQWATPIVFFKPITRNEVDPDTGEEIETSFPVLRSYTVFNLDQVDGESLERFRGDRRSAGSNFVDYEPAEEAIRAVEMHGAVIRHGGDRAVYVRPVEGGGGDYIRLPHKHQFVDVKEYYSTTFHELSHWSEVRLGWSGSYPEGELRAEIAASFISMELGVPQSDDLTNVNSYLASWLKALESAPRYIFSCSTAASRAADYILSFSRQTEPETEPEPALVE